MMMHSTNQCPQRDPLDRLVARARAFLLRWRLERELRLACAPALAWLFVGPLLLLVARALGGPMRVAQGPVNGWLTTGLALLGPALYVLWRVAGEYRRYRPDRPAGLALFDAQLGSQDRLVTADEFLSSDAPRNDARGFMQAAVDDAAHYVDRALQTSLAALPMPRWQVRPASWLGVPAALAIALLLSLGLGGAGAISQEAAEHLTARVDAPSASDREDPPRPARRREPRPAHAPRRESPAITEKEQVPASATAQRSRNDAAAEGQSNAGSASVAQSSSSAGNAAGQPSSQKNASRPKAEEAIPEEENEKTAAAKKRARNPEKPHQTATQAPTGKGKSGGSSSSISEFESPAQPDKAGMGVKEDERAEETEDEDEEEKSNSVTRPDLRDRRAPVDRNASTRPQSRGENNSDSNGRGSGIEGRKKTRGVPTLILGIPIPDRVTGKPNPGRSKVAQENVRPTAESHPDAEARQRLARNEAAGRVEQQRLLPWMRALVRDYFVSLHEQTVSSDERR